MHYLFIANWKMNLHFTAAIHYCQTHINQLQTLANNNSIILCPSFITLSSIQKIVQNTPIAIGAQTCSSYAFGAYTGQVSAQSLAEIDCKYCIVGHSEQRKYQHQSNEEIALQTEQLLLNEIQPIICIGETALDYFNHTSYEIITQQLMPIITVVEQLKSTIPLIIAYEPEWAIGQNIIPDISYLQKIFLWLNQHLLSHLPKQKITLIYGGSVNEKSITELKKVTLIQGFLIGSASTDFNVFQKIILAMH